MYWCSLLLHESQNHMRPSFSLSFRLHSMTSPIELGVRMGEWDSEWSLRHMVSVLRRAVLNATIKPNSGSVAELTQMVETLKNWANLAA